MKVLVANRSEIARRIIRASRTLGWSTVAIHTRAELSAPHVIEADEAVELSGSGGAAYLELDEIIKIATSVGADVLHPGYGFLSEDPRLPDACAAAGIAFAGPRAGLLSLFGDKSQARAHAQSVDVPVMRATESPTSLDAAAAFMASVGGPVMIKATSGGGGRGMREVHDPADLEQAWRRCRSEAERATGHADVYLEQLMPAAHHLEIQIVGDGEQIIHLGERDCSVQRRHQKLIEMAPSPMLPDDVRDLLVAAATRLTSDIGYAGLATVEFLVPTDDPSNFAFIEVNPRLQVEHTVTEQVTGVDLVAAQLRIATGQTLAGIGLTSLDQRPDRIAIQCRVNAEELGPDGSVRGTSGTVSALELPTDPHVRVDTGIEVGSVVDGSFDSLVAKVITTTSGHDLRSAADAAADALLRTTIDGVRTNRDTLLSILRGEAFASGGVTTSMLDDARRTTSPSEPADALVAQLTGTVIDVLARSGDTFGPRTSLAVVESMKMEHDVTAGFTGTVVSVEVRPGQQVEQGDVLMRLQPGDTGHGDTEDDVHVDLDLIRPDLATVLRDHEATTDAARPEAVAKRHAQGHRTARENIDDLVEPGSMVEYGALAVAAQRSRRSLEDLTASTPADGIITGLARIDLGGATPRSCAVLAYDYTVLAGTQGHFGHKKTDRLLTLAHDRQVPVVFFAEGGGGRPGDVDTALTVTSALDVPTFSLMGRLSGHVPTVGIVNGRCFAGNAAILGCCDVVIATSDSTVGMAGPAMIEGGGLGRFSPEEVGPMSVQAPNGVVDVLVDDDAEAIDVARRYLSYFDGPRTDWEASDQRVLRHVVPENRMKAYDIRRAITAFADVDSVLELRSDFGVGMITSLVRVEGRPMGLVANNPVHLGGAIDADAADKLARFLQLCNAHGLPVVSFCDTPGFMVGPAAEETATVRHFSRLFVIGSHLQVPLVTVVLRKAYGLGAQAMSAAGFRETVATLAWPTAEVGPMGLEGAVHLGFAKELDAISDPAERLARQNELIAEQYAAGKAVNAARTFELDDVIDPAETRRWITATLADTPVGRPAAHGYIDTW